MERALAVYRDLLGFHLEYLGEDEAESFSYTIFKIPRDIPTRFATLSSPAQTRTLALIEVPTDIPLVSAMPSAAAVVRVESVEATLQGAAGLGLERCEVRRHAKPAKGPGRIESAFYDFDAHPVVIFELI